MVARPRDDIADSDELRTYPTHIGAGVRGKIRQLTCAALGAGMLEL